MAKVKYYAKENSSIGTFQRANILRDIDKVFLFFLNTNYTN